jgi:hypothetical protein
LASIAETVKHAKSTHHKIWNQTQIVGRTFYILIHLVCPLVNLGHGRELGTDWARTRHRLGTGTGEIEHGLGTSTSETGHGHGRTEHEWARLGRGTQHRRTGHELGTNTGRLGTGRLGTVGLCSNVMGTH